MYQSSKSRYQINNKICLEYTPSCPSHLKAWFTQSPFEQCTELCGHAVDLHINGSRLSHVSNSHDWTDCVSDVTATHSPDCGFGCLSDQKPEYCETSVPAADSSVFVRKSSNEANPNQYLFDILFECTNESVTLFCSVNESIVISSAPYLHCARRKNARKQKRRIKNEEDDEYKIMKWNEIDKTKNHKWKGEQWNYLGKMCNSLSGEMCVCVVVCLNVSSEKYKK